MDKSNKDYKSLKDFLKHIEKINQINQELLEYQSSLKEKQAITFDYHDARYPYFEARESLKHDGEKPTTLVILLSGFLTAFIGIILGFIPVVLVYVLLSNVISTSFDLIIQYASYVIGVVVLIFAFLKFIGPIFHKLMAMRLSQLSKKREEDIELAKNQSIKMIESEQASLDSEIKALEQAIVKTEKSKRLLESKMDKDTFLHEHYYQYVHTLVQYFELGRVDTIKEAINLLENELKDQTYFERLVFALKDQSLTVDTLLDLNTPLRKIQEATKASETNEDLLHLDEPRPLEENQDSMTSERTEEPLDEAMVTPKKEKDSSLDEALLKAVVHEKEDETVDDKKKNKTKKKA